MNSVKPVGHIVTYHGYKGEMKVSVLDGLDEVFAGLKVIYVRHRNEDLPHRVQAMNHTGQSRFIIKLEDIDSKEEVLKLKKAELLAPADLIPNTAENNSSADLIGYAVYDTDKGLIGIVEDVYSGPGQELLAVKYGSKEVLIPLTLELIRELDESGKKIVFELPDGILEL